MEYQTPGFLNARAFQNATVQQVHVAAKQAVDPGQPLITISSEHGDITVRSNFSGIVRKVYVLEGNPIKHDQVVVKLEPTR